MARLWWLTKVGDNALQLDKDRRQFRSVERLVRLTQNQTFGKQSDKGDSMPDDEMQIGNEIHYHGGGKQDSFFSKAAGVALLAAGLGTGVAAPIAAYQYLKPDTQATEQGTDTDTQYNLKIYRAEDASTTPTE